MRLLLTFSWVVSLGLLGSSVASAQQADTVVPSIEQYKELNAQAIFYDAVRARRMGDNDSAEMLLNRVVSLDPNAAGAYYDLARLNLVKKDFKTAERHIKKAISLEPENRWYKERYAVMLMEQNRFKDAAELYEGIVEEDPNNKELLQTLAYIYQRSNNNKKAVATYDKLLEIYGDDEDILERKLQLYLNSNELDKALEVNNLLITIVPDESKYYIRLAEMYNNNNQKEKAVDVYRKAEKQFPDDPGIQLSLSDYYRNIGDEVNYKKYLKRVVTNSSLDANTQLTILQTYLMQHNAEEDRKFAMEMAKSIAMQSPDNAQALHAYANMLAISGINEQAEVQYKKSLDIDPANYQAWRNLLSLYVQANNVDSLLKYSDRALRIFPNQANLHFLRGVGFNSDKQFERAAKSIIRAIDMTPQENQGDMANMYSMLGDVYNSLKEYKESDRYFEKALEIQPNNPTTLNNYSYYLSERGERLSEAENMSRRSLELTPDMPTFLDTYGWILYKQGRYKKAKEYIEKAIEAEEEASSGTLWEHLGDIYYKLDDTVKAVECWSKAKDLGTDNVDIDKKIKDKKLYE